MAEEDHRSNSKPGLGSGKKMYNQTRAANAAPP
jgi:hypothetical protein